MFKSSNWLTYIVLLLAMVGWALSFVWFKVALGVYGSLTTVFYRFVIAVLVMFLVLWLGGRLYKPSRAELKLFALLAFFEPFLYFLGESYGLRYISSTLGAVIVATIPLFVPIAARIFHNEHPSGNFYLGAVLSLVGVAFVAFEPNLQFSLIGIALEFVAVFAAVGYSTVLKKVPTKIPILSVVFYQSLIGMVYFLPLWLVFEAGEAIAIPFNREAFVAIAELAVVSTILAFVLFTYGLRKIGVSRANVFVNAIPGFTAVFAWLILGETLNTYKILGLLFLFIGLWLSQRKSFKGVFKVNPS